MKKILERLIIFFVGLPLTVSSVYFLPHYHFLVLHLIIFGFTTVAVIEVHAILAKRMAVYPVSVALVTGLIIPLIAYGNALAYFSRVSWLFGIACALYGVFCSEIIYSFSKPFEKSIERMASGVFYYFLSGFFRFFCLKHDALGGSFSYYFRFFLDDIYLRLACMALRHTVREK